MNYYPHHLGDYAKDTSTLTMLEHGAYRLLLDYYYSTEGPIPHDEAYRAAKAVSKADKAAVDYVLKKFFQLHDGAHVQRRAEREISILNDVRERAQRNGQKGGRPPKQKPKDNPEETQRVISGFGLGSENETQTKALPRTNPQEPNQPTHTTREAATAEVEIFPPACTIEQAKQMAEQAGIPAEAAEAWWYDHDKRGWIDKQGHRVRNARSSIVAFGRQWQSFETKQIRELQAKRDAVTQRINSPRQPKPLSRMENITVISEDL